MRNIVFQALAEAARSGEPVALGIITGVKGSSPQKVGAKALFYADGRIKGTLGGGCLEAEIQQRAVQSLRTGQAGDVRPAARSRFRLGRRPDVRRQGVRVDPAQCAKGRGAVLERAG